MQGEVGDKRGNEGRMRRRRRRRRRRREKCMQVFLLIERKATGEEVREEGR